VTALRNVLSFFVSVEPAFGRFFFRASRSPAPAFLEAMNQALPTLD